MSLIRWFQERKNRLQQAREEQRLESLKLEFPAEWEKYQLYCMDWHIAGIYLLRLPNFEEYLAQKPLEVRTEVTRMLNDFGITA